MKVTKKERNKQRKIIQQKINPFAKLNVSIPPSGWIKAIRGSLGLSIRQLADRVGIEHGSINQIEKREPQKKVTLESLDKVARAMDCKVIYAIVPEESGKTLDDIIKRRATEMAASILKDVSHTMHLELQGTSEKQIKEEIRRIASDLIESGDARIWDVKSKKDRKK